MTLEKVVVLLVNYNTTELIPEVLNAIKEDKVDVSILIVDNGSSIEAYNQLIEIQDSRVEIVRIEENIGLGGGNNYGLQYIADNYKDNKHVFLLNTDAYICPNILFELKKILDANHDAASVTPRIIMKDGRPWYGGSMIDFKKGIVSSFIDIDQQDLKPYYEVDVFNACAVLFDFDKLREGGMLNEKLFIYYEEADLSMKLHKLGYKNLYTPHFTIIHDVSYTTRNVSFLKTYYMTRNKFILFNNTMSLTSKIYYLAHEFAYHLKNKKFKNAKYLLKGYLDFKRGRLGKLNLS
jgi:GT2 family glycosyltransferase